MSTTLQSAGLRELLKLKMIMLEELKCGSVRFWPRIKESTGAPRSTVYVYVVSRQTDRQTVRVHSVYPCYSGDEGKYSLILT